jgi:alpha-D-ribose 1-methylphosphonate 5-triphosphate synthase subunit PhnL
MEKILEVKGLEKQFLLHILNDKKILALNDIHLTLHRGEIIGLVGKSGSGKSTLMKCLYRTYLASAGQIVFFSDSLGPIDLIQADDHSILQLRKKEITYCAQFLSVIPRVSAVDVVAAGLYGRVLPDDESAQAAARRLLARLELAPDLWDAYPATFSGGEQQRVNVAKAVIANPRLLLIDEPTASLDQKTKDIVIDLILELKATGAAILVISHDSYTLDRLYDRQIELKNGKIESQIYP